MGQSASPERGQPLEPPPLTSPQSTVVAVSGEDLSLPDFLRRIADNLEHAAAASDEMVRLTDALLGGGLPALRAATADPVWLQYGLGCPVGSRTRLYQGLAELVHSHLNDRTAHEIFFVHKPPGVRIRFQIPAARRELLDSALQQTLQAWLDEELITEWAPGVYEPESHLFGGPISMRSVHRIFSADSIAWLDFHGADPMPGPPWAMSLLMTRGLFEALPVPDWEDIDVWDRLREQLGRQLDAGLRPEAGPVGAALRRAWNDPGRLWSVLEHATARPILEQYIAAVGTACREWHASYFSAPGAYVGPRQAVAHMIAFHWNRADLSATRQALIAEALAQPEN